LYSEPVRTPCGKPAVPGRSPVSARGGDMDLRRGDGDLGGDGYLARRIRVRVRVLLASSLLEALSRCVYVSGHVRRLAPDTSHCVSLSLCLPLCLPPTVSLSHCVFTHCASLCVSHCVSLPLCLPPTVSPTVSLPLCLHSLCLPPTDNTVSPFHCVSLSLCLPLCLPPTVSLSHCVSHCVPSTVSPLTVSPSH
jgi:hypothetical protein